MTTANMVIDARWVDRGGPGRITRNLLSGLVDLDGSESWRAVGPRSVLEKLVRNAGKVSDASTPPSWRAGLEAPFGDADVVVHLHHLRPLRRGKVPCVGMIYDTIPIRHARRGSARLIARSYLRRVASVSDRVLTISEYSRQCIIDDLGVDADRIDVLPFGTDPTLTAELRSVRGTAGVEAGFVFVGRSAPHKNIERLVEAHRLADTGLPLYLCTGGDPVDLSSGASDRMVVVPRISDSQLINQYLATAVAVVQPSFEEGLGLPVLEAAAGGVPVVASDIPALREVDPPTAYWFDPASTNELVEALRDAADKRAVADPKPAEFATPRAMAEALLASVERALA
jgi:glycosyltransferase involved in cell wall biosynthesis